MAGNPKFAILEKDGVEFGYQTEYVPEASDVLFEEGGQESVADHLKYPKNAIIPRDINHSIQVESRHSLQMHSPVMNNELYIDGEVYIL
jgi:hypothetical protein